MQSALKIVKILKRASLFCLLVLIGKLCKISFILGSRCAFFSGVNCVMPLASQFLGQTLGGITLLIPSLFSILLGKSLYLSLYHVPSFFASFYLASNSRVFRVVVPLVCIALFIVHPIGRQAFVYSFYWFIPIALSLVADRNIFFKALGATFVAHAVGSVFYLYFGFVAPQQWMLLLPVVVFERVLFACGIVSVSYIYSFSKKCVYNFLLRKNKNCVN